MMSERITGTVLLIRRRMATVIRRTVPMIPEKAVQSIEDVTNPLLNSINEKCARIKGAFVGEFDDYMAGHYYIKGTRGEPKRISLPRDLVAWE